jgi:threonine dehydratase
MQEKLETWSSEVNSELEQSIMAKDEEKKKKRTFKLLGTCPSMYSPTRTQTTADTIKLWS